MQVVIFTFDTGCFQAFLDFSDIINSTADSGTDVSEDDRMRFFIVSDFFHQIVIVDFAVWLRFNNLRFDTQ
ncbi:Uncharacterised protein [Klebsiella pneumoniae]|nr:Uncharacterised protein [Klebsiella pneumoniae]